MLLITLSKKEVTEKHITLYQYQQGKTIHANKTSTENFLNSISGRKA